MDDELRRLTQRMKAGGGTTAERVARVEAELGASFPPEYVEFLVATDGGAGPVGEGGYAAFHGVEQLPEVNRMYAAHPFEQFEGLVIFGGDGGGEAFCFDRDGRVVVVAYISAREDNVPVGPFPEFMRRLGAGRLFD